MAKNLTKFRYESEKLATLLTFPNWKQYHGTIYRLWLLLDCNFYWTWHTWILSFSLYRSSSRLIKKKKNKWKCAHWISFQRDLCFNDFNVCILRFRSVYSTQSVNAHDTILIPFDFSDGCWRQWIKLQRFFIRFKSKL